MVWRFGSGHTVESVERSLRSETEGPCPLKKCANRSKPRRFLSGSSFFVSTTGNDAAAGTVSHPFRTIQHALNLAVAPGSTVFVRGGTYAERVTLPHSGTAAGGFITLQSYPGEHVVLTGRGANNDDVGYGVNMIQILNQSYVRVGGFEIAYNSGATVGDDAFAVLVHGAGNGVQILNNTIHDMIGKVTRTSGGLNYGTAGAGIHVYGSSISSPYYNVIVSGNTLYNCQPGDDSTETLTLNGNIAGFSIDHNVVHDDNNIGIDMIGGEADIFGKPAGTLNLPVARNGVCDNNTVYNIHANYGGGYAAAIYVNGAKDIVIERNRVSTSDIGLSVGCENHGYVVTGVTVRDNIIDHNTQAGLDVGGYDASVGRVQSCTFTNNTLYHNDTTGQGNGELWVQWATKNVFENNAIHSTAQDLLIDSVTYTDNVSRYNLLFCDDGAASAQFTWGGRGYTGLSRYQSATGQDRTSGFANSRFTAPATGDFRLAPGSPAINAGDPALAPAPGETDFLGHPRKLGGRVDIGAIESA